VLMLVIAISVAHAFFEASHALSLDPDLYFIPVSTYFIPILYAALYFGLEGALPTAFLCIVLVVPEVNLFHHGAERVGVMVQLVILALMGAAVALKVDRERDAKLVAEAANQRLAGTQKSLESYIGMALRAQEEERRRLARELHDETIQDLLVARSALEGVPNGTAPPPQILLINDALQRSIDGIRRSCQALRPSVLDDLGLTPALEALLSGLEGRVAIKPRLEVEGECVRLDAEPELAVFRIAQQAIHNVQQHAQASEVGVKLTYDPDQFRLEVFDDGRGFDPHKLTGTGLGLAGMKERARLIGAVLQLSSRPGSTRIVLVLPMMSDR